MLPQGTYTAIVTPTVGRGEIHWALFQSLLDWQVASGVDGVVVGGTTGESPTLSERELERLFELALDRVPTKVEIIAATGRSHLDGTLSLTETAVDLGVRTILLVDPYYNGPSSMEIRREQIEPIATRFPGLGIVPYVIPGRTGTRLDPVDLARLVEDDRRIVSLKDATGDVDYAQEVRRRCPGLSILSGDDARTLSMMRDPSIGAAGVVSVAANLAPASVATFVRHARQGAWTEADREADRLRELFNMVTVRSLEAGPKGEVVPVRSRNPVPIKTALALLGVPVGACRPPLGRLAPAGLRSLVAALQRLQSTHPEVLRPLGDAFAVDVEKRLADPALYSELSYADW